MREIKFRLWDLDNKEMLYDDDFNLSSSFSFNSLFDISLEIEGEPGSYRLMQYTGLKDKNGKEIYESDLVKQIAEVNTQYDSFTHITIGEIRLIPSRGVVIVNRKTKLEHEEEWQKPKWYYKQLTAYRSEVIGNIYQTEEQTE